jgi:hypothetical protein
LLCKGDGYDAEEEINEHAPKTKEIARLPKVLKIRAKSIANLTPLFSVDEDCSACSDSEKGDEYVDLVFFNVIQMLLSRRRTAIVVEGNLESTHLYPSSCFPFTNIDFYRIIFLLTQFLSLTASSSYRASLLIKTLTFMLIYC